MIIKCHGCGFELKITDNMHSIECPKCGALHKFVEPDALLLGYDHSEIATDYTEVWITVQDSTENAENLDDDILMEEVLHVLEFGLEAPKDLLRVLQVYKGSGKLTKLQRKKLEDFYILSYCDKGFKA